MCNTRELENRNDVLSKCSMYERIRSTYEKTASGQKQQEQILRDKYEN